MNPNSIMNGYHSHNVASSSSNPYPEFHPNQSFFPNNTPNHMGMQHPHQSQPSQRISQRHWSQAVSNNHQPSPQLHQQRHQHQHQQQQQQQTQQQQTQQHQQQFNQSWPNSMQQQPFPNGMPGMAGFNMPMISPQVLHDAFAMSAPVEAADEMTMVTTLLSSRKRGETYKDALNSLHGKNNHSASLWKDYYLDHKDRLDRWIASLSSQEEERQKIMLLERSRDTQKPSIKKPHANFKVESSPSFTPPAPTSAHVKRPKQSTQPTPPSQLPQPTGSRRSTINSMTAPAPVYGSRLPPPNSEIQIPEPPSRSPSPPTKVIPHKGRGNKYTQEDRDFFIKFISWRLKQNPELTRFDLCNLLEEKAPHHTSQSWASHWSNNHDIPDKILAAARGDEYESGGESESGEEEEIPQKRQRPKYKESSSEETVSESEDAKGDEDEDEDENDEDDDGPVRQYSETEMGFKGGPFTEADHYITAKYIVSFPTFHESTSKDRWEPYSERYPQRSAKSWAEYYRRNEKMIDKLVRRIKRKDVVNQSSNQSTSSISSQCGKSSLIPPKVKRKHDIDSEDVDGVVTKRGRESGD